MGEFKKAIKKGGPLLAISVCADKAPEIANAISRKTGWMVRRVSLKTRNPMNNPDAYETKFLQETESSPGKKTGEIAEVIEIGGRKEFRYMKVIKTAPPCLTCHGMTEKIAPEIKKEIISRYPYDRATGYKPGDIRGAFSIRIPLKQGNAT
jgi:hypothetical protein